MFYNVQDFGFQMFMIRPIHHFLVTHMCSITSPCSYFCCTNCSLVITLITKNNMAIVPTFFLVFYFLLIIILLSYGWKRNSARCKIIKQVTIQRCPQQHFTQRQSKSFQFKVWLDSRIRPKLVSVWEHLSVASCLDKLF